MNLKKCICCDNETEEGTEVCDKCKEKRFCLF